MSGMQAQVQRLVDMLGLPLPRPDQARRIAEAIRAEGFYRWVGLYDVDQAAGLVRCIAWSGPAPPTHAEFRTDQGITSRAIALGRSVNVGDVSQDADYLTALEGTRSEIIVPVLDGGRVVGTIDVESEYPDDFGATAQRYLEQCAQALLGLWSNP